MNTEPIHPHPVGTRVIVVLNNPAERAFASKITEILAPHKGHPRYALEGKPQLAYFHRELFTTQEAATLYVSNELYCARTPHCDDS